MSDSPTSRTLLCLRSRGLMVGITEKFNSYTNTRHDLFGFIDLLAVDNIQTIGIQCTSGTNVSSRIAKILDEYQENAIKWLSCSSRSLEVWGWRKLQTPKKRGLTRKVWFPKRVQIYLNSNESLCTEELPDLYE